MAARSITTDFPFSVFSHEADIDYLLARWIHFAGGGFHARAGYFAHQSSELYMKAFMVQTFGQYLETHKLLTIAGKCEKCDTYFGTKSTVEMLRRFDAFDQVGRYGGAAKHDPHSRQTEDIQIAGGFLWSDADLRLLDEFVSHVRGKLDFRSVGFADSLKDILDNNRKNIFFSRWKGYPDIREVLTKDNAYFPA